MDTQENKNPNVNGTSSWQTVGSFIWDLLKILIIALVIIVPFRMFVAEPFVVSGSSMMPNFHNGDYLIIDRMSYLSSGPQRGDVIVLLYPKDTSQFFIKRVIGLPGETIQFPPAGSPNYGHVVIYNHDHPDGWVLAESYIPAGVITYSAPQKITLGSGEYFVLGDNRTASSDSRIWGILPKNDIVGKVWLRVFPFSTGGFFHTPSY